MYKESYFKSLEEFERSLKKESQTIEDKKVYVNYCQPCLGQNPDCPECLEGNDGI